MKPSTSRPGKPGFVSYVLVLSTGLILTTLMVLTYNRVVNAHEVQSKVQLRTDYSEKEDAVLRSIVAITPNRAIMAMKHGSNASSATSDPLRWKTIFTDALNLANARTSISPELKTSLNIAKVRSGNSGDSTSTLDLTRIFDAIPPVSASSDIYVSTGNNRDPGSTYPPPLTTSDAVNTLDKKYPIISSAKVYGSLAQTALNASGVGLSVTNYPKFNRLKYPQINFGYAKPGEPFVAKRNWWAFSMDVSGQDAEAALPNGEKTVVSRMARPGRDFVLSIYEIPSQLAISASSFMSLGKYASGDIWTNDKVKIAGGVFAGKVRMENEILADNKTSYDALASRRSMALDRDSTIGGQSFSNNPFAPGVREKFLLTEGEFFPVSLASESGRVAFVPISRGKDFFDRFRHSTESNVLSPTTWNSYSIGALQCAMWLDIIQVESATNKQPTKVRFSYLKNGVRKSVDISLKTGDYPGLPPGYLFACNENQTYNFGSAVVDVAYGKNGTYAFQTGITGSVTFNNDRFGDPLVGTFKSGYYKPSYPFEVKRLGSTDKICVAVYPQRFAKFLTSLNADGPAVNNSLVVNVDYTTATGSVWLTEPKIPCDDFDYGVILQECADLTSFTKGFSLVTNLRLYIGDDFNVVEAVRPADCPAPADNPTEKFYPPCSLFAPEKRYGVDVDPFAVNLGGQIGSLAGADKVNVTDEDPTMVRPLDSKAMSGASLGSSKITVNLRPIRHPAELPPVTMMNWLVVLEELRKEYVNY